MELAKAWFRTGEPSCPEEMRVLLDSHEATRGVVLLSGRPEYVTPLPERGEGRNHDLWLLGRTPAGQVTVCVEAKAAEPFGERLGKQLQTARKRQPRTGAPDRAKALLKVLFGGAPNPEADPWRDVRYQLITALAGTALQALRDGSAAAVLIIHEFQSSLTAPEKLAQNHADLEALTTLLVPDSPKVVTGKLAGPIQLGPTDLLPQGMRLLLGKVVTDLGVIGGASRR